MLLYFYSENLEPQSEGATSKLPKSQDFRRFDSDTSHTTEVFKAKETLNKNIKIIHLLTVAKTGGRGTPHFARLQTVLNPKFIFPHSGHVQSPSLRESNVTHYKVREFDRMNN